MSGLPCPHCGNLEVWFAENPMLHYARAVVGTNKRYCPNCNKEYRVRSISRSDNFSAPAFLYFVAFLLVGACVFVVVSDMLEKRSAGRITYQGSSSPGIGSDMMSGLQQSMGAGGLQGMDKEQIKEKLKKNPGALAALRNNPKLLEEAKRKYGGMK